jgi:hypothetical protein
LNVEPKQTNNAREGRKIENFMFYLIKTEKCWMRYLRARSASEKIETEWDKALARKASLI